MAEVLALDAERSVIGAMLIDPDCIADILPRLRGDDFALDSTRSVFETIRAMRQAGARIDALTVAEAMKADNNMRAFLAELMEITPTSANAPEYAQIVRDTGKRRRLRDALRDAVTGLDERQEDSEVVAGIERALGDYHDDTAQDILTPMDQHDGFFRYRELVDQGANTHTRTGLRGFDKLLGGGMVNAGLYFLAARPGTGKTALALQIAEHVAKTQGPVCFVSLEMTAAQLMARRYAAESGVDSRLLLSEKLTDDEYEKLARASGELSRRKLYITEKLLDAPGAASIIQGVKGVRLAVIDHFTLFRRPHKQPDHTEYAEIAHTLAHLAKAIGAPVLCLIQLNRESEKTKGRPRLGDLRGSGATEEDAAGVLILHNEGEAQEDEDGIAPRCVRAYLDKNRFGGTGSIGLSYYPKVNRFREAFVS